ncbi:DUF2799 domain-containing protein [Halomonas daqiaonensis]|uniref:DUF2799 domain-containing protein n=1 Tax=Halomonas daqiaonensis TaxID=650850 RepID=A0A1H7KYB5_9GAMM|nr:DUF2799 domain-containing protein [Halomonas daqiaonensis]SEK91564.1 Protein of unknown function [Halomonas daqiaonensis]
MTRRHLLTLIFILLALSLSGCATLSEGECRTANWQELGRIDGTQGQPRARLFEHAKACADYGIRPDAEAYYRGRERGLLDYCTPANAYREGRRGATYRGVCPALLEGNFLESYRQGLAIHEVESELEGLERQIQRVEHRLDDEEVASDEIQELHRELRSLYRDYRFRQQELLRLEQYHGRYGRMLPR